MTTLTVVKKYFLSAVAVLFMMFAAQAMHAQIGPGNVTFTIDNQEALNGYPNVTGANVTANTPLTAGISVNGVTGNQGTTYVSCYDSQAGLVFSWSTQVTAHTTFQFSPAAGQHSMYCTANYTGEHVNGTATTGTISFTAED